MNLHMIRIFFLLEYRQYNIFADWMILRKIEELKSSVEKKTVMNT